MPRTNIQRFNEAMGYLQAFFPGIANMIGNLARNRAEQFGKEISLPTLLWLGQSEDKKMSVRALLLCQTVLLPGRCTLDLTKTHYRSYGEDHVRSAIRCYMTLLRASLDDVGDAAQVPSVKAQPDFAIVTRATPNWTGTCYTAVLHWLFQAGFVSLPHLAEGFPHGQSPNVVLGRGDEVQANHNWPRQFQKGEIFNIHVSGFEMQNHWGVSLGNGLAAAVNNGGTRNDALRTETNFRTLTTIPDHTMFPLLALARFMQGPRGYNLLDPLAAHGRYLVIRRISPIRNQGSAFAEAA